MKSSQKAGLMITLSLMAILSSNLIFTTYAEETLYWTDWVYSTGAPLESPILENGKQYRIVAKTVFSYGAGAADAQYYTTDTSDLWHWGNYFKPDGHSFLQIDGMDVDWGPFDNGEIIDGKYVGHEYSINYLGAGMTITFTIVDWIDGDYSNNACHLVIHIYESPPTVMGYSPGYWKHQFKAHIDGKGKPHHSWEELELWTADIDAYYGIDPPIFDGYELIPVDMLDYDGDGHFTTDDAYNVFTDVTYNHYRVPLANWYNWASGNPPYSD